MKIQIKSTEVETIKGNSRATGKPYEIRKQGALFQNGDEVRKMNVMLGRDQSPYAPGLYEVDASSFDVNNFGDLFINRLVLSPLRAAQRAA